MKLQQPTQHPGTMLATAFHAKLIKHQVEAQRKGITIPDTFMYELLGYAQRNAQAFSKTAVHTCCPACLKAHALRVAHEQNYPEETKKYLAKILPGVQGHDGYYLDDSALVKVPSF